MGARRPADWTRTRRVRWSRIGDREATSMNPAQWSSSRPWVRHACGQDRAVCHPQTGERAGRLFAVVRRTAPLGECVLELRARPNQPARRATLLLSATAIESSSPGALALAWAVNRASSAQQCGSGKSSLTSQKGWNGSGCVMRRSQASNRPESVHSSMLPDGSSQSFIKPSRVVLVRKAPT